MFDTVYVVVFEYDHESSLGAYRSRESAEQFCEDNDWSFIDENGFEWTLDIIEEDADEWSGCADDPIDCYADDDPFSGMYLPWDEDEAEWLLLV